MADPIKRSTVNTLSYVCFWRSGPIIRRLTHLTSGLIKRNPLYLLNVATCFLGFIFLTQILHSYVLHIPVLYLLPSFCMGFEANDIDNACIVTLQIHNTNLHTKHFLDAEGSSHPSLLFILHCSFSCDKKQPTLCSSTYRSLPSSPPPLHPRPCPLFTLARAD